MRAPNRLSRRYYLLFLTGMPLTACSPDPMIVSAHLPTNSDEPLQGLPYYLPKAVIPISIVGNDGLDMSGKGTSPTVASPATSGMGGTPGSGGASKTGQMAFAASATQTASPQITVNVSSASSTAAGKPKDGPASYKLTVTAGKPLIVPDPAAEYYLHYTPDGFSDDTLGLHIDQNGLLQSSKGQSIDQTAAIGGALAQLAAVAAGVPGAGGLPPGVFNAYDLTGNTNQPEKRKSGNKIRTLDKCMLPSINKAFTIDPGASGQDDGFEEPELSVPIVLHRSGLEPTTWVIASDGTDPYSPQSQWIKLTIATSVADPSFQGVTFEPTLNTKRPDQPKGIIFRDWADWTIDIDVLPSEEAKKVCHVSEMKHRIRDLLLPNRGQKFWASMNRQTLINKQVGLTVQNGMLTGVDLNRPSTVLAWLELPLKIVAAPFKSIIGASTSATPASTTSGN